METQNLIVYDEEILGGTAVFTGTRVPVKTLFDYLKTNHPLDDFLEDFPSVARAHAQAVLDFSGQRIQDIPHEVAV